MVKLRSILLFLVLYSTACLGAPRSNSASLGSGCSINTNKDLSKTQPLVLVHSKNGEYEFAYPESGDIINFSNRDQVILACPGSSFEDKNTQDIREISCSGGSDFDSGNSKKPLSDMECTKLPESNLKKIGTCEGEKTLLKVGFDVGNSGFLPVMDLCFDENNNIPVYTVHKITSNIKGSQKGFERSSFNESFLFKDVATTQAYKNNNQRTMFLKTLSNHVAQKYIQGNHFLAKGHCVPKADFVFGAQQDATFYYANTAPQWQAFNSGNWQKLEAGIRRLAAQKKINLTVYTGVHGVLKISDKELYLTETSSGRKTIPVPQIFWKVVHDEKADRAVAFVGINDPFADRKDNVATNLQKENICDQINWVSFNNDPEKGLMYCYNVKDIQYKIKSMPKIKNAYILN
ncbi:uncharacterized protein LOC126907637 [Daktulosphaira vitifoliae]|uniref:uncharacterized protein LOC126907637 n=1 Tax=Daktulosphaira vitifoliae TaxID=58002 RepID=UPI0021A9DD0A|nr:uncharacterized protein LOC126907637 [Daktulosphaira vitifoliae]